jgi:hypothetical protein
MTVDLTLRLHRFRLIPILYHLSLEAKSRDGRETMVMEHFPEMDPTNTDPNIVSLIGLKSLSDPKPSFEVIFQAHPEHTVESLARFSRSRPRKYWFLVNDCRTHSFAVIKHALRAPPELSRSHEATNPMRSRGFDFWRFDKNL